MYQHRVGRGEELRGLTIARFFAAMWVVFYHTKGFWGWVGQVADGGWMGVPFFFILSGFVLSYSARCDYSLGSTRRDFWLRRFARIYPVYLLAWLLFASWQIPAWVGAGHLGIGRDTAYYGGLTALLVQNWVPGVHPAWNPPAWSLCVEVVFYASFPFIYLQLFKRTTKTLLGVLAVMLVLNAAQSVLGEIKTPIEGMNTTWGTYLNFHPILRVPQFVAGMIMGLLFVRHGALNYSLTLTAVAIAGLVGLAMSGTQLGVFVVPVICLLVISLAGIKVRGALADFGVLLGKSSYSIYILQTPVWALLWTGVLGQELRRTRDIYDVAEYCVVLIAVSIAVYLLVEAPLERIIKRRFTLRRAAAPAEVVAA